jgi:hypothetical protein
MRRVFRERTLAGKLVGYGRRLRSRGAGKGRRGEQEKREAKHGVLGVKLNGVSLCLAAIISSVTSAGRSS